MATHTITKTIQTPEGQTSKSKSYTGSSVVAVEESVSNGATDLQINIAIDVSAIKSVYIASDKAVTIETNSGSVPDDTLTLVADVPYEWQTDSYSACLLTVDVTKVYVTNSSGGTATLQIYCLQDATP